MSPRLLSLSPSLHIHWYGIFVVLGIACILAASAYDRRLRTLVTLDDIFEGAGGVIFGALVGARLWYVLIDSPDIRFSHIFSLWDGGLSLMGAFIAGMLSLILVARRYSTSWIIICDTICTYVPFGLALGRIGCWLAGCCHGMACSYRWASIYTDPEHLAPLHIPLHPTQLYSAVILAILGAWALTKIHTQPSGTAIAWCLMICGLERWLIDWLRADHYHALTGIGWSWHQVIAAGLFLAGSGLYAILYLHATRKEVHV